MNIQQRKALEKIVKNTISEKKDELFSKKDQKYNELESSLANKNRKEATQLFAKKISLEKEAEETKKKIEKLGFDINYDKELEPDLPSEQKKEIDQEYHKKEKELVKVETKLTAKVWGVEGDFNDLMKDIERELARF